VCRHASAARVDDVVGSMQHVSCALIEREERHEQQITMVASRGMNVDMPTPRQTISLLAVGTERTAVSATVGWGARRAAAGDPPSRAPNPARFKLFIEIFTC
jgi:hypothetical protein